MAKQVQQFITRVTREIKEKGLTGISGVSFIKGARNYGTPMDVLKSKRSEGLLYGTHARRFSVGEVAVDMNAMFDCTDALDGTPHFKKRVSGGLIPKGAGIPLEPFNDNVERMAVENLVDPSFKFNDSQKMTEIERLEKAPKHTNLPEQVEKVSPIADEIICRHIANAIKD